MDVMISGSVSEAAFTPGVVTRTQATVGRVFYGVAILTFGALHAAYGDFVTRVVPWWPAAIPGRPVWVYTVAILLVAAGAALLSQRRTSDVSMLLAWALLLSFVGLGLPLAFQDSLWGGGWTVAGKLLALGGGAFLVAESSATRAPALPSGLPPDDARLVRVGALGAWFFAAFLVLCGIQHFIHAAFVMTLVPAWIPPGALFWTYAAGVMLIAGGVGLLVPPTMRLAGRLTGLMIFGWVFLVHIPRAAATFPGTPGETTAVFEALAMSGIAWLAAARAEGRWQRVDGRR